MDSNAGRFRLLFSLAIAGLLFSGYLSSVRFISSACAFNEPCPYFLGYPACYYGFAMFLAMAITLAQNFFGSISRVRTLSIVLCVSGLGILFAGYFTSRELPRLISEGVSSYLLGLPTCAYGLLVYIAIFAITLAVRRGELKKIVE